MSKGTIPYTSRIVPPSWEIPDNTSARLADFTRVDENHGADSQPALMCVVGRNYRVCTIVASRLDCTYILSLAGRRQKRRPACSRFCLHFWYKIPINHHPPRFQPYIERRPWVSASEDICWRRLLTETTRIPSMVLAHVNYNVYHPSRSFCFL